MERMRAIRQHALGGPEVLELTEVDRPEPGPTEVLVRVHAAGVNPVDWKTRQSGAMLGQPPFTLGWDTSGVVAALGRGVTRFQVGDEVYGMPRFPHAAGGYAEYLTGPSRHFARKPPGLDHVAAAGLPLAGLTAWQALVDTAQLAAGQRVLVHAAAGGVGHLAVQIAKALGAAHVAGTASAGNHALLRELGADQVIDYASEDVAEVTGDLDVVLDPIGGDTAERSVRALRPGGVLIRITGGTPEAAQAAAEAKRVRIANLLVEPDHAGLERLSRLVEKGQLRVQVAETFPLAEAAAAHERSETGHTAGKIVLVVRP